MKCPKCGKEIPNDSIFCEYCGEQLRKNPPPQQTPQKPQSPELASEQGVKKKAVLITALCILAILAIGIIVWLMMPDKSKVKSPIEPIPGYQMVWVEGGKFIRGDVAAAPDDDNYTTNTDSVEISGFYMGIHEVSQEIWEQVMGSNPSYNDDDKRNPVEDVTFAAVNNFIDKANAMYASKLQHKKLSLPTEAEWEYAAGGGNKARGKVRYSGFVLDNSWHKDNARNQTHPVGSLQPNQLGIYDMTGNVSEWCQDYYSYAFYKSSTRKNPINTVNEDYGRVCRGGSFLDGKEELKITYRYFEKKSHKTIGLRLVLK